MIGEISFELPAKMAEKGSVTGPMARQCKTGVALIILGFGLHFFDAGEVVMSMVFSGIAISLPGLVVLSGLLIWHGGKRIVAWVASWKATEPPRPVVLARLGSTE